MIWQKIRNRLKSKNYHFGPYLIEIALIIFSILIAIQADRFNQNRKDKAKLENYFQSMYQDLLDEQESNRNNLYDCRDDIQSIERAIQLCRYDQNDSLNLSLQYLRRVFGRGVFRTFSPTTFDIMLSTGDIALIRDLSLRNRLAATFSFRDTYVRDDLEKFDTRTIELSRAMGRYFDLGCMATTKSEWLYTCLTDRTGFVENVHNELFIFLRMTSLRAFHLEIAVQNFDRTIKEMEDSIKSIEPAE